MGKQVTKGFFAGLKEAGANLLPSIWGDGSSADDSSHSHKSEHGHSSGHGRKVDHTSGHSLDSDHGLGDMGVDSNTSVRVTQHCGSLKPAGLLRLAVRRTVPNQNRKIPVYCWVKHEVQPHEHMAVFQLYCHY